MVVGGGVEWERIRIISSLLAVGRDIPFSGIHEAWTVRTIKAKIELRGCQNPSILGPKLPPMHSLTSNNGDKPGRSRNEGMAKIVKKAGEGKTIFQ